MTLRLLLVLLVLAPLAGCRSFDLDAPPDFVELEESDWSGFALRAVNADGVVLAVRDVENEPEGTLDFWTNAIRNRLRTVRGYALLEDRPVTAASGEAGHQLRLGRDEGSHTYDYWVTVFVTPGGVLFPGHVHVVEAGGAREEFTKVKDALEVAIRGFEVK